MIHSTKLLHLQLWMRASFKFKSNAFTLELLLCKSYTVYCWVPYVISLKLKEELIEAPNVSFFFLFLFFNPCTVLAELIWRMGCVRNNISHVLCSIIHVDADNVCLMHALCSSHVLPMRAAAEYGRRAMETLAVAKWRNNHREAASERALLIH